MVDAVRLREIDGMLAVLSPRWSVAVLAVMDALPGISGRPAGNGDPPGGRGASLVSVVERAALADGVSVFERDLERMRGLPHRCVVEADILAGEMGVPAIALPSRGVPRQEWAFVSWMVVLCVELVEQHRRSAPMDQVRALFDLVADAAALVARWAPAPPAPPASAAPAAPAASRGVSPAVTSHGSGDVLVVELTGRWCRSCLRIGRRDLRSDRFAADGVCRWCGEWFGAHGSWPSVGILEARRDGVRITPALVAAAQPPKPHKPKKPKKNRRK